MQNIKMIAKPKSPAWTSCDIAKFYAKVLGCYLLGNNLLKHQPVSQLKISVAIKFHGNFSEMF